MGPVRGWGKGGEGDPTYKRSVDHPTGAADPKRRRGKKGEETSYLSCSAYLPISLADYMKRGDREEGKEGVTGPTHLFRQGGIKDFPRGGEEKKGEKRESTNP